MTPFLKWAGGKRWLAKQLSERKPDRFNRYIEPFLGSGAIFFELKPESAILSDANEDLIETYRAVRDHPKLISARLTELQVCHSRELYYTMRAARPTEKVEAAARFIYLNRTCWNGLYRVNQKNEFNVPIGTKNSVVLPSDDFEAVAKVLDSIEIRCCDFEDTIDDAADGDFIYVDPPYTVKHNFNGFLKYNQVMFTWGDQVRLRDALLRARKRGCSIVVSNADHESIRDLYSDFSFSALPRASVISGTSRARGTTTELLVVHYG